MERTATPARIVQQLRKERVAQWHALVQQLDCSTKTVQRALAQVGYYNSLNYNATFVTLQDVPRFDQHGLWTYQDVHFSQHGNLPQTIHQLIERAPAGYTVEELEGPVGTRVHNHVSRLLREGTLARCFQGRSVVYLAADPRRRKGQETVRRQAEPPAAPAIPKTDLPPGLDALTVIAVLVRLLEAPEASGASVARTLQARGRTVRAEQVRQIIAFYGLKKRPAEDDRTVPATAPRGVPGMAAAADSRSPEALISMWWPMNHLSAMPPFEDGPGSKTTLNCKRHGKKKWLL